MLNWKREYKPLASTPKDAVRRQNGIVHPIVLTIIILICVGLVATAATARFARQFELSRAQHEVLSSIPEVNAVKAIQADSKTTLLLPGDMQPIQNVPIYARANGYLVKRFVDIGDNVKAGDLLAVIDTPELDQQVQQLQANLRMAQATLVSAIADKENYASQLFAAEAAIKQAKTNLDFSSVEIGRYQKLAAEGAYSREQSDQAVKLYNSDSAQIQINEHNRTAIQAQETAAQARIVAARESVQSNRSGLEQLKALQAFQKVTAPTDGVITERFVDAGSLVAAGGSSGTTELLAMAKTDVLRIYVDVPQSDYRQIKNGDRADVLLQEFPGQTFVGKVTNIAGSLKSESRTLRTEIRIDNHAHILTPGSYAQVRFVYNNPTPATVVPSNAAVTKNDGLYVPVVENGKVHYHPVEVARDLGNKIEISTGVKPNDVVLLDAPDSLADGAQVKPLLQQIAAAK